MWKSWFPDKRLSTLNVSGRDCCHCSTRSEPAFKMTERTPSSSKLVDYEGDSDTSDRSADLLLLNAERNSQRIPVQGLDRVKHETQELNKLCSERKESSYATAPNDCQCYCCRSISLSMLFVNDSFDNSDTNGTGRTTDGVRRRHVRNRRHGNQATNDENSLKTVTTSQEAHFQVEIVRKKVSSENRLENQHKLRSYKEKLQIKLTRDQIQESTISDRLQDIHSKATQSMKLLSSLGNFSSCLQLTDRSMFRLRDTISELMDHDHPKKRCTNAKFNSAVKMRYLQKQIISATEEEDSVKKLVQEHRKRKEEYNMAVRNFFRFLDKPRLTAKQLQILETQYEEIKRTYHNTQDSFGKKVPQFINRQSSVIVKVAQELQPMLGAFSSQMKQLEQLTISLSKDLPRLEIPQQRTPTEYLEREPVGPIPSAQGDSAERPIPDAVFGQRPPTVSASAQNCVCACARCPKQKKGSHSW